MNLTTKSGAQNWSPLVKFFSPLFVASYAKRYAAVNHIASIRKKVLNMGIFLGPRKMNMYFLKWLFDKIKMPRTLRQRFCTYVWNKHSYSVSD